MSSIFFAYLLGMLGCVAWKWARWMQRQSKGTPWPVYWEHGLSENISSGIVTLLAYGLWSSGLLLSAASAVHQALTGIHEPLTIGISSYTSAVAGFVIDYAARWLGPKLAKVFGGSEEGEPRDG